MRQAKYLYWWLTARLGGRVSTVEGRTTVLITYYDPLRLQHLDSQIRQALRCDFVERVIVSNHNPAFRIEEKSRVRARAEGVRSSVARGQRSRR
jgi:hypothetical protein